jgi:hypothetical protein
LEITELRLCIVDVLERDELVPLREMLGRPDGYFAYTGRLMHELAAELDRAGQAPAWLRWLPAALLGDAAPHPADQALPATVDRGLTRAGRDRLRPGGRRPARSPRRTSGGGR